MNSTTKFRLEIFFRMIYLFLLQYAGEKKHIVVKPGFDLKDFRSEQLDEQRNLLY